MGAAKVIELLHASRHQPETVRSTGRYDNLDPYDGVRGHGLPRVPEG